MHDRAAADQGLFRQYMGYAIVFGHVTEWIAAFDAPDTSDWFASSSPLELRVHRLHRRVAVEPAAVGVVDLRVRRRRRRCRRRLAAAGAAGAGSGLAR